MDLRNLLLFLLFPLLCSAARVETGADRLFKEQEHLICGRKVGLITNQTGVDRHLCSTIDRLHRSSARLVALFSPEHGLQGAVHAGEAVSGRSGKIPIHSLHGETRRPTDAMLRGIDLLIFDIQDVGVRCYTYPSTLFYVMEEAAKRSIPVIVLDRPNPINGVVVDGPMMEESYRSFIGYINVPFVHGMTIGELALFFNGEYKIGCDLMVVKMRGWRRTMTFSETGLPWVPTSPMIPEPDTPLYYASTSMLGETTHTASVGVGTTTPFKVVGAPWIDQMKFAEALNRQKFAGVTFQPYSFTPFFGRYKQQLCHGVRIAITDPASYRPVATQYLIMGVLKSLYPDQFRRGFEMAEPGRPFLCKMYGSSKELGLIARHQYITWPLIEKADKERTGFMKRREKYLIY